MYSNQHHDYYDTKHYVRITPHVLATPVHVELTKQCGNTDENEDLLFVAVSYYLGENEFEELFQYKRFESTDSRRENEVRRGEYVANAIMAYILGDYGGRWASGRRSDPARCSLSEGSSGVMSIWQWQGERFIFHQQFVQLRCGRQASSSTGTPWRRGLNVTPPQIFSIL